MTRIHQDGWMYYVSERPLGSFSDVKFTDVAPEPLQRTSRRSESNKGVLLMNEPVTKMDPRFSNPDAVATGWDETCRVLETAELFWISTVRADGRPHVSTL